MAVNLKQLETFYWAVRLGSFAAVAERFRATQSAVSMRIQELERELGASLFDRRQRSARINVQGRILLPLAEQMIRLEGEIRAAFASADTFPGTLRLGVAEVISVTWLPRLIQEIHAKYPRVTIEMDEALTEDLIHRLRNGSLDLVLAPGTTAGGSLNATYLGSVDFAWMASSTLPLPRKTMTPRDLLEWPIITLSRESYHHNSIEEWFRSGAAVFKRADTCKSLSVAASLAAAGLGIALLPIRCFKHELAAGRLRAVKTVRPMPSVPFSAICAIDGTQPLANAVAEMAAEVSDFGR